MAGASSHDARVGDCREAPGSSVNASHGQLAVSTPWAVAGRSSRQAASRAHRARAPRRAAMKRPFSHRGCRSAVSLQRSARPGKDATVVQKEISNLDVLFAIRTCVRFDKKRPLADRGAHCGRQDSSGANAFGHGLGGGAPSVDGIGTRYYFRKKLAKEILKAPTSTRW